MVWFIDNETKKWIYEIIGGLSRFDLNSISDLFRKEFDFSDQDVAPKPKAKKEDVRAAADWFCLHFVILNSLVLNYTYRVAFATFV